MSTSSEIILRWMPEKTFCGKLTLVPVMVPSGKKPLLEPVVIRIYIAIWRHQSFHIHRPLQLHNLQSTADYLCIDTLGFVCFLSIISLVIHEGCMLLITLPNTHVYEYCLDLFNLAPTFCVPFAQCVGSPYPLHIIQKLIKFDRRWSSRKRSFYVVAYNQF